MTRPFSASTMSGDFDFPPANNRLTDSTLGEEARTVVQNARSHRTALLRHLDEARRLTDQMTDSDDRRRIRLQQSAVREEIRRRHGSTDVDTLYNSPTDNAQAPTSAMRLRMENVHRRARSRMQNRGTTAGTGGTVQEAVNRLNEASSIMSTAFDQSMPSTGSPEATAREYSEEAEMNRRRKRRKMEVDGPSKGHMNGFSYGYRGQVVPGPLMMELVSCDGGIHTDAARNGKEYWPENVLKNDKSVYCTDNNKCNIILRHMGETPFCLKKLVIKAPERGFTAPIQEGMIFVSMTTRELLLRTSQYQLLEPSPLRHSQDAADLSIFENEDEPRPRSRRQDSGAQRTIPPPISDSMLRSARYNYDNPTPSTPHESLPPIAHNSGPDPTSTPPPHTIGPTEDLGFNVTTTCEDPSSDEEEASSPATLADLYRRDRLPPPYDSSTTSEDEESFQTAIRRVGRNGAPLSHRRGRRRAEPSRIEATRVSAVAGLESDVDSVKDVLAPHARFFIEREKSVVSIKFDPPVSGKFILLKLWSPSRDQNIDIQSIICHGFSGPRFFPAIQLM